MSGLTPADLTSPRVAKCLRHITSAMMHDKAGEALSAYAQFLARVAEITDIQKGPEELLEEARVIACDKITVPADPGARARITVEGWGGLSVAYERAFQLRDAIAEDAERRGGCTITEQLIRLRAGDLSFRRAKWAMAVRDAVMFGLLLRIPLRQGTLAGLRLKRASSMDEVRRTSLWITQRGEDLWSGALRLECPPGAMKRDREYKPNLICLEQVGEERPEARLRRDLLEAYLRPDGARDFLLGGSNDEGWFWVGTKGKRITRPSDLIKRRLIKHGPSLGVDVQLLAEGSCSGTHGFRHLFGSNFASKNLTATSAVLHHVGSYITERVYSAFSERDVDVDTLDPATTPSRPAK